MASVADCDNAALRAAAEGFASFDAQNQAVCRCNDGTDVDALDIEQCIRARAPPATGTRHRVIRVRGSSGVGLLGRYPFKEALTPFPPHHAASPRSTRRCVSRLPTNYEQPVSHRPPYPCSSAKSLLRARRGADTWTSLARRPEFVADGLGLANRQPRFPPAIAVSGYACRDRISSPRTSSREHSSRARCNVSLACVGTCTPVEVWSLDRAATTASIAAARES